MVSLGHNELKYSSKRKSPWPNMVILLLLYKQLQTSTTQNKSVLFFQRHTNDILVSETPNASFENIIVWKEIYFYICRVTADSQWVNSVPPYVRKLHFMYEVIHTSGKYRWNIYRTSSKCRWSIYRTSSKRRGTLRIVHKIERSSPTVRLVDNEFSDLFLKPSLIGWSCCNIVANV